MAHKMCFTYVLKSKAIVLFVCILSANWSLMLKMYSLIRGQIYWCCMGNFAIFVHFVLKLEPDIVLLLHTFIDVLWVILLFVPILSINWSLMLKKYSFIVGHIYWSLKLLKWEKMKSRKWVSIQQVTFIH